MQLEKINTERLYLIPFTPDICKEALNHEFSSLAAIGIQLGDGWPDADMLDTLPRIIDKLNLVDTPSGFESWMIIERETNAIIGDTGFKGLPDVNGTIDVGYGITASARRKGYATEAVKGLINWALQQPEVTGITASCEISNVTSAKLLKALGFILKGKNNKMFEWKLWPSVFVI
ncbi:GNAT family N-acetyltransferase [Pedobacter sp. PAMC26386]|nr:GNAT family N-acetyltransferase [Pedobacter sp. PAMC26386]